MSEACKTVLEVLQSTTAYFTKHGIESARLNSEHLVAHALGKKRIELYLEFDRPLFEKDLAPLRELIRNRAQGKPLQHLLGTVDFHGHIFACDSRALIPRPETEQLVELVLSKPKSEMPRIIDVGTGSGVIALTIAAKLATAVVDAVDLCETALTLARENAERQGLAERVNFFQGDLLENAKGPYDIIVANLPYIATDAIPALSREVQCDPVMALDGGGNGLEIISRLIVSAKNHLAPHGLLALEIGHDQSEVLIAQMEQENYQDIQCKSDYQGVLRFLMAKYG